MSLSRQHRLAHGATRLLHWAVVVAAGAAVLSLAVERGFYHPERHVSVRLLHVVQAVAVGLFVLWRIEQLWAAVDRRRYLRDYWLDFALIVIGMGVLVAARELFLAAGTIYVATIQLFLGVQLIVEAFRVHVAVSAAALPPPRLLVASFLILIVAGTALLMLPKATTFDNVYGRMPYKHALNCLFTATSATCVTGLVVYDTGTDFSLFGQVVILVLIQLGGLGIMIFGSVFGLLLGRQLSVRQSVMMQDVLSHQTLGEIGRLVRFILVVTLAIEALGAVALYPMFARQLGDHPYPWFYAVFHSVSAFCNAGFALQADSLVRYRGAWQVYGVVMPLIVLGGLGFPVLYDLGEQLAARFGKWWPANRLRAYRPALRRRPLSLHSRIVLVSSVVLVVAGALLLWVGETVRASSGGEVWREGQMASMTAGPRALAAMFQSVTARTAGFNTVPLDPGSLSPGSHFLLCLLMFIGGSPGSTAGGVKTVTVAVMLLAVLATLKRRENVESFGRTLVPEMVRRAAAIITLGFALLSGAILLLCYSESASLLPVLFESFSAFGTVGLSTGLTPHLTEMGRCVIILLMFAGRIGPLTLLIALAGKEQAVRYDYPAENVIMG